MKRFLLSIFITSVALSINAQSIFTNPITGSNPSADNPYTTGQTVNANITVTGIGRGSGISANAGSDRYNANSWNTATLDQNAYFQWTLTPNAGFEIDFVSFVYTGQRSNTGPNSFAFRSSLDGYTANIGTPTATGTTINLSASTYQNICGSITFRLYGWGATSSAGTFSVNSFTFNGTVTSNVPSTQVSAIDITNASPTSQSLVLTRGNGSNVLVVARAGAAPTADPVVGTTYTANTAYGSGSALGGGFVVYNGTGTSFTVTGQTNGQTYFYRAYEFNCTTAPAYTTPSFEASKLPVELISFQGTAQNKAALLTFSTATEINNAYFSIERSADGARYTEIGQVPGAGTSTELNEYTYTDEKPLPGVNYYRLRQVDFDGQFAYSPVVSVVFGSTDARLRITPVPASDEVTVQFTEPVAESITWEVYDQSGRLVLQGTEASEVEQFGFNVAGLAEGFYILRVGNGREVMTERFQKR